MTIALPHPLTLDALATFTSWNVTVEELSIGQVYCEFEFNLDEAVLITGLNRRGDDIVITGVDPLDGTAVEATLRDDLSVSLLTAPTGASD